MGVAGKGLLAVAGAIMALALMAQSASALGIRNCTGEPIRVTIYKDLGNKLLPLRTKTLNTGTSHSFKLARKRYVAKIFRSRPGRDEYDGGGEVYGATDYSVVKNPVKIELGIGTVSHDFQIRKSKSCR